MRQHFYKPGYWLWWWRNRAGKDTRGAAYLLLFLLIGVGGYVAAKTVTDPEQIVTEQVITVTRTTVVNGKPRVVTELRTIRVTSPPKLRTVTRDGDRVLVPQPGETVISTTTVKGPVRTKDRVVTKVVAGKTRLVTLPGKTLPGTTITGPERVITTTLPATTITAPGETVDRETIRTVAGPTVTTTNTVTGPTQTVTGPTQTITHTNTVTGPTQTVTGPTQTVSGPTQTVTGPTTTVTGPTVTVTGPTRTVTETETVTVTQPPGP